MWKDPTKRHSHQLFGGPKNCTYSHSVWLEDARDFCLFGIAAGQSIDLGELRHDLMVNDSVLVLQKSWKRKWIPSRLAAFTKRSTVNLRPPKIEDYFWGDWFAQPPPSSFMFHHVPFLWWEERYFQIDQIGEVVGKKHVHCHSQIWNISSTAAELSAKLDPCYARWWFQIFCIFPPYLGKWSNLTN